METRHLPSPKPATLNFGQDWKKNGTLLGEKVRPYDPTPPPAASVDLDLYPLKVAEISKDPSKKGWAKYRISLSNEGRGRYLSDVVHAPSWKQLVGDFDAKYPGLILYKHQTKFFAFDSRLAPSSQ